MFALGMNMTVIDAKSCKIQVLMFKCYINQLGMDWLSMCGVFGTK